MYDWELQMFNRVRFPLLATCAVILLSMYGCGGSSGGSPADDMAGGDDAMAGGDDAMAGGDDAMPSFGMPGFLDPRIAADDWRHDAAAYARRLTGGQEPTLSSSGHDAKARQIAGDSNTIAILSFWNGDDGYGWGQSDPNCSGTTCDWNDPDNPPLTKETYVPPYDQITIFPVMKRNGVETHVSAYNGANSLGPWEGETFAGLLDHAIFGTTYQWWDSGEQSASRYIFGDATGSNPADGTASWSGLMIGVATTATYDAWMQGDADITVNFGPSTTLDVSFSNVLEFENGTSLSIDPWTSIPVANGSYQSGSNFGDDGDRYLEGQFFGPNAEETGGVFYDWFNSDPNVYFEGAFGAARDQQ